MALQQEDAVRAVAARCGYTPEAIERAFRARYWSQSVDREQPLRTYARRPGVPMGRGR